MIPNELPGNISNPEEFKKRKRSDEDCGPKFYGKWVGTGWGKVKQEYQQQLCSCKKKHGTIVDVMRLYPTALDVTQSIF